MDINNIPIKQDVNPVSDSRTQVSAEEFNTIVDAVRGSVCDVNVRNDENGHLVIEAEKNKGTSHPIRMPSASESFDGILSKEDKKKIEDAAKGIPVLNSKIVTETERAEQAEAELYNEWNDKKNEFNQKLDFVIQSCQDNNEKNDALVGEWSNAQTSINEAKDNANRAAENANEKAEAVLEQQAQVNALIGQVTELGAANNANAVSYDNSQSGMTAVNVQSAIDELSGGKVSNRGTEEQIGFAEVVNIDGIVSPKIPVARLEYSDSSNLFDKYNQKVIVNVAVQSSSRTLVSNPTGALFLLPFKTAANMYLTACSFNHTWNELGIEEIAIVDTPEYPSVGGSYGRRGVPNTSPEYNRTYTSDPYSKDGDYLSIVIKFTSQENYTNNLQTAVNNLVVKKSFGTHKWATEYEEPSTPSLVPLFAQKEDVNDKLNKNFGVQNAGKLLNVGPDGNVELRESPDSNTDVTSCARIEQVRTLHMGENLIANIKGAGEGWTEAEGVYTHTSGIDKPLEFSLPTTAGEAYVAILYTGTPVFVENQINVSIGNGELCDIYRGITGPYYIGMISDGGNLKITPDLYYTNTVHSIELRKIVPAEESVLSYDFNPDNIATVGDAKLTSFWNVAIGADKSTMGKMQNGSRNIAIGLNTMSETVSGERNVAIGTFALNQLKHGCRNIAIGADALYRSSKSNSNVAIGKAAAGYTHSNPDEHSYNSNTAIGHNSLAGSAKNYKNNTGVGAGSLYGGVGDNDRVDNTAVGHEAGYYGKNSNTAVGARAGRYSKGDRNVFLGAETGDLSETGSDNILIGYRAKVLSGEGTWQKPVEHNNSIVIGANAQATKSNQVVIGNSSQTEMIVLGNKLLKFNSDGSVTWETITT